MPVILGDLPQIRHQQHCDEGEPDLDFHGIVRSADGALYVQVLLQIAKENSIISKTNWG